MAEGKRGKVSVVTGSSRGIGKAIVMAFAKSKEFFSTIVTNSRSIEEAQKVSGEIKSPGYSSIAVEADISKEGDFVFA